LVSDIKRNISPKLYPEKYTQHVRARPARDAQFFFLNFEKLSHIIEKAPILESGARLPSPSLVIAPAIKEKGLLSWIGNSKVINCEHVIVQRWCDFVIFFQLNLNKLYPISVTRIVDVTYATYHCLSKRRLCKEHVGRKVKNAPGDNLRRNLAFARTSSFSPRVK